ncbi:MAG TPA: GntR family transcriptional regulator [Candidatus Limnocylindrales bacterium]|nr:GntR family transcriptional regulator [Candidatus Limnocylindrales bacterium]
MLAEPAISRGVLSDTVKDRLLAAILDGRYPPGARIVETRVAKQLGTSQAPVREALRDLEALGVVEITAFRGARVRRPTPQELLDAFDVRSELEALAVRLALPRLADGDLDELGRLLEAMRRASASGDTVAEAAADTAFHAFIVGRSGNGTLLRVWDRLEPFSRTYISLAIPGADQERIVALHAGILDALRGRDAARADAAIRHHFADTGEMLVARLAANPAFAPQPDATPEGPA